MRRLSHCSQLQQTTPLHLHLQGSPGKRLQIPHRCTSVAHDTSQPFGCGAASGVCFVDVIGVIGQAVPDGSALGLRVGGP